MLHTGKQNLKQPPGKPAAVFALTPAYTILVWKPVHVPEGEEQN